MKYLIIAAVILCIALIVIEIGNKNNTFYPDNNHVKYLLDNKKYNEAYHFIKSRYFDIWGRAKVDMRYKVYKKDKDFLPGLTTSAPPPYKSLYELTFPSVNNNMYHLAFNAALSEPDPKRRFWLLSRVASKIFAQGGNDFFSDYARNYQCLLRTVKSCVLQGMKDSFLYSPLKSQAKAEVIALFIALGENKEADNMLRGFHTEFMPGAAYYTLEDYFLGALITNGCIYNKISQYKSLFFLYLNRGGQKPVDLNTSNAYIERKLLECHAILLK